VLMGTTTKEFGGADGVIRAGTAHELHAEDVSEKFGGCRGVFDMQANVMDTGVAASSRCFRSQSTGCIAYIRGVELIVDARLLPGLLQAFFGILDECD